LCDGCGASLASPEAWQAPFPGLASPNSYTPGHLAKKILTSKAALEGERKQVTVLFADMKGSTEYVAGLDPHEARRLLDPILNRMMEAVHRYEGTVNQVMGDGIMAIFGAPLAHEDHAIRACYSALEMKESIGKYAEEVRRTECVLPQIRIEAVKRVLLRESEVQPLLWVLEDLHSIDAETQALIDGLVDGLPAARFLLLVSYRPEYRHGWGNKTYYTQLRIDPLTQAAAYEMLDSLVGALTGEPGAYRAAKSISDFPPPVTIEALLTSRIDRLSLSDNRLLQFAAVVGSPAPLGVLETIGEFSPDDVRRRSARRHPQARPAPRFVAVDLDASHSCRHHLRGA
jgi:hypothetical protein